jgi:hypothetical protein
MEVSILISRYFHMNGTYYLFYSVQIVIEVFSHFPNILFPVLGANP